MDREPKHRSNFLSMQIAMITLQHYLNLDSLIVACMAPGHSYTNPPEKVNCVLNLGPDAIGYMRSAVHSDPGFERHLSNCQGVNVRNLYEKNPDQSAKLLKICLDLIKAVFSHLQLKESKIQVRDMIIDSEVSPFFKEENLDKLLKPTEKKPI